jgi:hypothetical protein
MDEIRGHVIKDVGEHVQNVYEGRHKVASV